MSADPKKISEYRKADREATANPEFRQAKALEEISDTLEAIRQDFAGLIVFLGRVIK